MSEIDQIKDRYARRDAESRSRPARLWDSFSLLSTHERRSHLLGCLHRHFAGRGMENLTAIDIGCGGGGSLMQMIEVGLDPSNLVGVELIEYRAAEARHRLPSATQILQGDATAIDLPAGSFDIVQQATVFTSILNDDVQRALADRMWELLRPGGIIVWYDFIYNNPRNPDVRGVSRARVGELFPHGKMTLHRLTLAPPVGRPAARLSHLLYWTLWCLPFLRSHVFIVIEKA